MKRAISLVGALPLLRESTPARRFVVLFGLILLTCASSPGQSSPGQITVYPPSAVRPQTKMMTVDDVIRLSQAGLSDNTIIAQIKMRPQHFNLSADERLGGLSTYL